jgi:hypothetical protein
MDLDGRLAFHHDDLESEELAQGFRGVGLDEDASSADITGDELRRPLGADERDFELRWDAWCSSILGSAQWFLSFLGLSLKRRRLAIDVASYHILTPNDQREKRKTQEALTVYP